jgi:hypothetical protein
MVELTTQQEGLILVIGAAREGHEEQDDEDGDGAGGDVSRGRSVTGWTVGKSERAYIQKHQPRQPHISKTYENAPLKVRGRSDCIRGQVTHAK